jgi:hypothetical protein
MVVANCPLCVDEVVARPILVVKGFPDRVVAVDRYRVCDFQVLNGLRHVRLIFFKGELGCVHANYNQAVILVFLRPRLHIGNGPEAIDARIGPEIDDNDLAFQTLTRAGHGIQPGDRAVETRQRSFVSELYLSRLLCG